MSTASLPLLLLSTSLLAQALPAHHPQHSWTLSTSKVQRIIVLEDGCLFTQSSIDRSTGHDLQGGAQADELGATVDGKEVTGLAGGWSLFSEQELRQNDQS